MRFIYMDEAGTSGAAHETVTVVVGIIVQADEPWRQAKERLDALRSEHVPQVLQAGHRFHALDLYHQPRRAGLDPYRVGAREAILGGLLSAPKDLGMSVVFAYRRRVDPPDPMADHVLRHIATFAACLYSGRAFVGRSWPGETVTFVAEDDTKMRAKLRTVLATMRQASSPAWMRDMPSDMIVDAVHFAEKGEAPLLQFADAAAFTIRRALEGRADGMRLMQHLLPGAPPFDPLETAGGYSLGFELIERWSARA